MKTNSWMNGTGQGSDGLRAMTKSEQDFIKGVMAVWSAKNCGAQTIQVSDANAAKN